jgi:hypothetical protein
MIIRAIVNGLLIQKSFYNRIDPQKPIECKVLSRSVEEPWLFMDRTLCPDCTCKYSCRYGSGPPSYLTNKNYNPFMVNKKEEEKIILHSQKGPAFGNTSWFSFHPRKDSSSL